MVLDEIDNNTNITEEEFLLRLPSVFREIYKKAPKGDEYNKANLVLTDNKANWKRWTNHFINWSSQKNIDGFEWSDFYNQRYTLCITNFDFNISKTIPLKSWYCRSFLFQKFVKDIKKEFGITFVEEDFKITYKRT